MSTNIQDNILFGTPMEEERYQKVLFACALCEDLKSFESGDKTPVDERGTWLSGGQKQQIALARALYSCSPVVLLDDSLSFMDSNTAQRVFDNCIKGPLMQNRTCILVTHKTSLDIFRSQHIFVLENGEIAIQGVSPTNVVNNLNELGGVTAGKDSSIDQPIHSELAGTATATSYQDSFLNLPIPIPDSGTPLVNVVSLYLQSISPW
jgi:ABC-type transport system involved in cytochrome bd biosynthesis fused ATPase/permease subunit